MRTDLYRIDDVLLRAGGLVSLVLVAGAGILVLVGLTGNAAGAPEPGFALLRRHARPLLLAATCPAGLLWAGFAMRRRERHAIAVERLLRHSLEVHVPDLIANSDHTRADLERAVRLLNNEGVGYYVWDKKSDVLRDGRLDSFYLHVDKCEGCQASIALQVPASLREVPRCPYCGDPIPIEHLRQLKREAIEGMRAEHAPRAQAQAARASSGGPLSLPLFLILLVTFWPAAVVYVWIKWQSAPTELRRA